MKKIWKLSALPAVGLLGLATIAPTQAMETVLLGLTLDGLRQPVVEIFGASDGAPAVDSTKPGAQVIADLLNAGCVFVVQIEIEPNPLKFDKQGGVKLADPRPSPVQLFNCPAK